MAHTDETNRRPVGRVVILTLLGLILLLGFAYQYFFIARHDFYVAHHFWNLRGAMRWNALALSVAYGALFLFLRWDRRLSARTVMLTALIGLVLLSMIAFATHPTRSQDIYWSLLLGKGFVTHGANPYVTSAGTFSKDPWAYPILEWKEVPMVYGPIWTLFISGAALLTRSLGVALVLIRILFLLALISMGNMVRAILRMHQVVPAQSSRLLLLLAWNPFLIQSGIIDLHNDVLVMVAIVASYYFLLRKQYSMSIVSLVLGGLVKYTPLFLIAVPLWLWIKRDFRHPRVLIRGLATTFLVSAGLVYALYAPFGGISPNSLTGILSLVDHRSIVETERLSGTTVLLSIFSLSFEWVRIIGFVLAACILAYCLRRDRLLEAYSLPFLGMFFFATPWFQPWYFLWAFPLMLIAWPNLWFVALTASALFMPELISPSIGSLICVTVASALTVWRFCFSESATNERLFGVGS